MFEFKEILSIEENAFISDGFRKHALDAVGQDGNITEFAFTFRETGVLLGALKGQLFWGSLHIKNLFVHSDYRRQGIGKQLIQAALEFGRKKGCCFTVVETMSFQALDFYRKLGFHIDFSRSGCDNIPLVIEESV